MKKNVLNIIKILLAIVIFWGILINFSNISYAADVNDITASKIREYGNSCGTCAEALNYVWRQYWRGTEYLSDEDLVNGVKTRDEFEHLRQHIIDDLNRGMSDVTGIANSWSPKLEGDSGSAFSNKMGVIIGIVRTIGIFVSVASIMLIGVKYMFSSIEEKAVAKKELLSWVIGAIMVIGLLSVVSLIYDFVTSFTG